MGRVDIHWIRFWNNRDALTDSQLTAIKTEISQGHPVAVGMRWPNRTRFVKGTYLLEVPRRRDIFDGHCVALIGYKDDPAIPGGGSFLFRNSWGAGWADGGYASMPYELLRFCVNDALSARIERSNLLLTTIPPGHEASALRVSAVTGPPPKVEDMSSFGPTLAGKTQLHFSPSAVGQSFTVDVPIPERGEYSLRVSITRQEDFGKYLIDVREKSPKYRPAEIDGAGPGVSQSWPILIDRLRLKSGYCHVTFKAVGQNSASHGIGIGIDQIELVRQP